MPNEIETVDGLHLHTEDLEYSRPNGQPLLARLYRPQGPGPFPGVVEVHGGAWTSGSRLNNDTLMEAVCAHGIVALSLDFRMPPDAMYPTSLQDINLGIRWFKAHCAAYGVDPKRVGGLGTSSGGHQIFLSAMRPKDSRYCALTAPGLETVDASLHYVIAGWPVIDPLSRYHMAVRTKNQKKITSHHDFWGNEAAMAEGNPQMLLERGEKAEMPPGLIIQGTNDDNVDWRMIDKFGETYHNAGGSVDVRKYEGEIHGFIKEDLNAPAAVDAIKRIVTFIHAQNKRAPR